MFQIFKKLSHKNVVKLNRSLKQGQTLIFITNWIHNSLVLFGSVQLEYQTFCIWYFGILPALVVHCHQHMNGYYPFSNPSLLILKLRMNDLMYVFISTTKLTLLDFTSNDGQKKENLVKLNLPYIYPHGKLDFRYTINPSLQ